jgi:hypothetical protein
MSIRPEGSRLNRLTTVPPDIFITEKKINGSIMNGCPVLLRSAFSTPQ